MNHYDLVIIGAGSGNQFPGGAFDHWKIAIVEEDKFGGTCLQRGCIPSKMFAYTAEVARHVRHSHLFGIDAELKHVDWPAIRDRVFSRIDPLHAPAVHYRQKHNIDVYSERASFIDAHSLQVGDQTITADRFVIAAGSRPTVPDIAGLDDIDYFTSDNIMRIDDLPETMTIIGGGYIAAEMAHIFGAFGTEVTIIARGAQLLTHHDSDIRHRFTELARTRFLVHLNSEVRSVSQNSDTQTVTFTSDGEEFSVQSSALLIATGRTPNNDRLAVSNAKVEVDEHGHVIKDSAGKTSQNHIWALGDISNHFQLKHMANAEARLVWHNLTSTDTQTRNFNVVPAAVFAEPQVASVGETEEQLTKRAANFIGKTRMYAATAYGWALQDETSFVKVLADSKTRLILGAHIIGPEAAILIQPLVQAMFLDNTVDELANDVIYLHPALSEVIEQVLLDI